MVTTSIRALLMEAGEGPEELQLGKTPVAAAPTSDLSGSAMSDDDFAPAPPPGPAGAPALAPLPGMPTGPNTQNIVQQEIVNKVALAGKLAALKGAVATFEKLVQKESLPIEDARTHMHNFLTDLAVKADDLASLVGEQMGAEGPEAAPVEEPMPEPVQTGSMTEPVAGPSTGMELSEPVEPEQSTFTNPTEAI